MHMDKPSSLSIWLYESHSYFKVPAISSSPDIFLMLLRASESLVIYLSDGKLIILSIMFDDIDNFSTAMRLLRTLGSSLSMGGFLI
jgi:hypothetical protein